MTARQPTGFLKLPGTTSASTPTRNSLSVSTGLVATLVARRGAGGSPTG